MWPTSPAGSHVRSSCRRPRSGSSPTRKRRWAPCRGSASSSPTRTCWSVRTSCARPSRPPASRERRHRYSTSSSSKRAGNDRTPRSRRSSTTSTRSSGGLPKPSDSHSVSGSYARCTAGCWPACAAASACPARFVPGAPSRALLRDAPDRAAGRRSDPLDRAVPRGSQDAGSRRSRTRIIALRERYRLDARTIPSSNVTALVDLVCERPIVSSRAVEDRLGVTRPTALKLLRQLEGIGVLTETASGPRGQRRYVAHELIAAVAEEAS